MKRFFAVIIIAVFIIVGIVVYKNKDSKSETAHEITVIKPSVKTLYDYVNASGRIKEGTRRDIYIQDVAEVSEVFVNLGEDVRAGDALFSLAPVKTKFSLTKSLEEDTNSIITIFEDYGFDASEATKDIVSVKHDDKTVIKSPINGKITSIDVNEGDVISALRRAVSVSDFSDLYISVKVPEAYSGRVSEGADVQISAEAFGDNVYSGKVESIAPVAKYVPAITGEGKTYIDAVVRPNSVNKLFRPQLSVNAKITIATIKGAVTLPYECVLQEGEKEFVFCVEDGIAKKRMIKTGYELENEVQIVNGVARDSKIIYNPSKEIENNDEVTIKNYMEK